MAPIDDISKQVWKNLKMNSIFIIFFGAAIGFFETLIGYFVEPKKYLGTVYIDISSPSTVSPSPKTPGQNDFSFYVVMIVVIVLLLFLTKELISYSKICKSLPK